MNLVINAIFDVQMHDCPVSMCSESFNFCLLSHSLCSMSEHKIALIPSVCCNKIPQTRSLKVTEIYSLKVMEARSLKLRHQQGYAPFEDSREESFFASFSFWWLPAIPGGVPWLVDISLQSLLPSSHDHLACAFVFLWLYMAFL